MFRRKRNGQHGQAIALFALALTAIVLGTAIVVDGGYAYAQRRQTQNAADFAAMAGTRIVGQSLTGRPVGAGTAANVRAAIDTALAANDASLVDAQYVDHTGAAMGSVLGASSIPDGAFGVVVDAKSNWKPFLLGLIGVTDWIANASATAITPGESIGGGVLPVGLNAGTYNDLKSCPSDDLASCLSQPLTPGNNINEGSFGWLSFGLSSGPGGKCNWTSSLGMVNDGGCDTNNPFLQTQIGPPSDSHGCCTAVDQPGSVDRIHTYTGNTWGDLSFYVDNQIPVWVPIYADDPNQPVGTGNNAYYDIIGFGAVVFLDDGIEHAKWLRGAAVETPWCAYSDEEKYCPGPGGSFKIDVTGEVQLRR